MPHPPRQPHRRAGWVFACQREPLSSKQPRHPNRRPPRPSSSQPQTRLPHRPRQPQPETATNPTTPSSATASTGGPPQTRVPHPPRQPHRRAGWGIRVPTRTALLPINPSSQPETTAPLITSTTNPTTPSSATASTRDRHKPDYPILRDSLNRRTATNPGAPSSATASPSCRVGYSRANANRSPPHKPASQPPKPRNSG